MNSSFSLFALVGVVALLTGCGTISNVESAAGKEVDWRKYDRALVLDFADAVSDKAKPSAQTRKKAEMAVRTKSFPDRIAIELGAKKVFREVVRTGAPGTNTLIISGVITRYEEGNLENRLLIGLGSGSAYFDAIVEFKDGANSEILATQKIDKNSWALGGAIAATHTADAFMEEAAVKLTEGIAAAKQTGKLAKGK